MSVLFIVLCTNVLPAAAMTPMSNGADVLENYVILTSPSTHANVAAPTKYLLAEVNYLDNDLELIEEDTGKVISTMKVGQGPLSVMPCPGTMDAAVLNEDNKIVIVNMSSKEVLANIYLVPKDAGGIGTIDWTGSVDHIFWRHDGKYLYVVTNTFLAVINAQTYQVEKCYDVVGSRVAADISPDGSTMLLFRKVKDSTYMVDRLNTTSNVIEKSRLFNLSFDATNVGPLKFSPNGTVAYTFIDDMGSTGWIGVEPNLVVINSGTLDVQMIEDALPNVKSASRINRMDLEVSPDGKRLYMLYSSCELMKIRWSEIHTYNLENCTYESTFYSDARQMGAIALSADGGRIYVANYCDYFSRANTIGILNATDGQTTGHIEVGYGPMDVKLVPVAKA
ncbi:YncE family protein [Methanocella sp. MCL-LM]|uniref:YncE family protein n=1 Tax=Methanocella sp. MCL-LM TaxID=3412035 RepID=UPI003C78310B